MKANPDPKEFGGSILMSGFGDLEESEQASAQKIVAHAEGRLKELCGEEMTLKLTMKKVHAKEKSEKYEVHAKLNFKGGLKVAVAVERSILVALNSVLEKIEHEIR